MSAVTIVTISKDELTELIGNQLRKILQEREFEKTENAGSVFQSNEFLNIHEAAIFLKLKIATIYGYTSKRQIPFIKRGKKIYFEKSKLEQWLMADTRESIPDIQKRLRG